MNTKATTSHLQLVISGALLVLAVSACSTQAATSQSSARGSGDSAIRVAGETSHVPEILRVVERQETRDGAHYYHEDIYFQDLQGDAAALANKLAGMDPEGGLFFRVADDPITASAEEQKREGLITSTLGCYALTLDPFSVTIEDRVRDQAGNVSQPVRFTITCPANPASNVPFLIAGGLVGRLLLVVTWRFFYSHPDETGPTLRAILLFFCVLMPVMFMLSILHEGGHMLSQAGQGLANRVVYVHPFAFAGYSRPVWEWREIAAHAAGALTAILGALLISALLWKRRSTTTFALVALFPVVAVGNGGYILLASGDFRNIMNITGLQPVVFGLMGLPIILVGAFCLVSLLPMLGLSPVDKRTLLVLPVAYFLWALLSVIVAYVFVPASPFAMRWHLVGEILSSANSVLWVPFIGLALALFYLTVYRWLWPRLPEWLRTPKADPGWKDLRIPGLLAAISVIAGLAVIL